MVIALSFVLLIVALRTVVVPAQAAVMNLLSIGASYGVLTAVFQYGWLSGVIGLEGPVPIVSYVPLFMFAVLFGLSMDYEVFLVSQIEEHVHAGQDNRDSVVSGLVTSARVITAAALIMAFVFGSFVLNGDPTIKQFGVGLAVAVILDATVVRCLLVPALMLMMGRLNWWMPRWLDRAVPASTSRARSTLRTPPRPRPGAPSPCGPVQAGRQRADPADELRAPLSSGQARPRVRPSPAGGTCVCPDSARAGRARRASTRTGGSSRGSCGARRRARRSRAPRRRARSS